MNTPSSPAAIVDAGVQTLRLTVSAEAQARLLAYQDELSKWNVAYNLTAIRVPAEMAVKHLLDSLTLLPLVQGRVLDVGAGAGLPGIVLAIANSDLRVSVLDSNGKKARFMRHVVRHLGLNNVEVIEQRVEAYENADGFDCIVSRAFATLADFCDKTTHLLAEGGVWVAMKGKLDDQELAGRPAHVVIRETRRLQVPGLNEERHAVVATLNK